LPPQHWLESWQLLPSEMQQAGSVPSWPLGHVALAPPKHLGVPDASSLHTARWPLQQFWEALMARTPPSGSLAEPHTLPAALQDTPLSHRSPAHWTLAIVPAPQQLLLSLQRLAVVWQPLTG
jgi:hypothetical protein